MPRHPRKEKGVAEAHPKEKGARKAREVKAEEKETKGRARARILAEENRISLLMLLRCAVCI